MFHYHSPTTSSSSSSSLTNPVLPLNFQMLNTHHVERTSRSPTPSSSSSRHHHKKLKPKTPAKSHSASAAASLPKMSITNTVAIRPATAADLPTCVHIETSANASSPIVSIPWPSYTSSLAVFEDRQRYMLLRPWEFQFLVAIAVAKDGREEIIGFLIGHRPTRDGAEEWHPNLPVGTNEAFLGYYLGCLKGCKEALGVNQRGYWELDTLAIAPRWQRRGVGMRLVGEWLRFVDADVEGRNGVYVMSSWEGKGLYERFGWRGVSDLSLPELGGFGYAGGEFRLWNLVREASLGSVGGKGKVKDGVPAGEEWRRVVGF